MSSRRVSLVNSLNKGVRLSVALSGLLFSTQSHAQQPKVFRPTPDLDLRAFTSLIAVGSAALQAAQLDVELSDAEVNQARRLENPTADFSWATIPIGETNPEGLRSPYANVPSYNVGVSYRFLIGKRGPRTERAQALRESAQATKESIARQQALELVHVLGYWAIATMRKDAASGILEDARRSVELVKSRASGGFSTPLDVDRMEIEQSRVQQVILRSEGEEANERAACSALLGIACEGFAGTEQARAFLRTWVDRGFNLPSPDLDRRPDIRALAAQQKAASAESRYAEAMAIPDPTIRFGYVHDRFVISGNQQNSLNLSVSVPVPIFDSGQAMRQAAASRASRYSGQKERVLASATARIPALRGSLELARRRQSTIAGEMLPKARAVLADVEKAASNRLVALTDVIQARRIVHELLVEEADSLITAFDASIELLSQVSESESRGAGQ